MIGVSTRPRVYPRSEALDRWVERTTGTTTTRPLSEERRRYDRTVATQHDIRSRIVREGIPQHGTGHDAHD